MIRFSFALLLAVALTACSTRPPQSSAARGTGAAVTTPPATGKFYLDDGPPDVAPESLEGTPDAVVREEPLHRFANRAYVVFGRTYTPRTVNATFIEQGIASWYGRKFHGKRTASGEVYDMFAMTAAHPTAPLPSYMRVTNLENGRRAVVRVNDRGPFLHDRVIDLSYAAAAKLGFARKGSARVEIELLAANPTADAVMPLTPVDRAPEMLPRADEGGFSIQIGAFASAANADAFVNQVTRFVSDALGVAPKVYFGSGMHRVRVGPFATQDAAAQAAQLLRERVGLTGVVANKN